MDYIHHKVDNRTPVAAARASGHIFFCIFFSVSAYCFLHCVLCLHMCYLCVLRSVSASASLMFSLTAGTPTLSSNGRLIEFHLLFRLRTGRAALWMTVELMIHTAEPDTKGLTKRKTTVFDMKTEGNVSD